MAVGITFQSSESHRSKIKGKRHHFFLTRQLTQESSHSTRSASPLAPNREILNQHVRRSKKEKSFKSTNLDSESRNFERARTSSIPNRKIFERPYLDSEFKILARAHTSTAPPARKLLLLSIPSFLSSCIRHGYCANLLLACRATTALEVTTCKKHEDEVGGVSQYSAVSARQKKYVC